MSDDVITNTFIINIDNVIVGNSIILPENFTGNAFVSYKLLPDFTVVISSSLYEDYVCGNWIVGQDIPINLFECSYKITAKDENTFLNITEGSQANIWYDNGINILLQSNEQNNLGTVVFDIIVREKTNIENYAVVSGEMSIVAPTKLGT